MKYVIHIGDNTMRKWKAYVKFIRHLRLFILDTAEIWGETIFYLKEYYFIHLLSLRNLVTVARSYICPLYHIVINKLFNSSKKQNWKISPVRLTSREIWWKIILKTKIFFFKTSKMITYKIVPLKFKILLQTTNKVFFWWYENFVK